MSCPHLHPSQRHSSPWCSDWCEKMETENARLCAALELISKEQDYTESQSTGTRFYHETYGACIAKAALAACDADSKGEKS